jgi:hypothetical protein
MLVHLFQLHLCMGKVQSKTKSLRKQRNDMGEERQEINYSSVAFADATRSAYMPRDLSKIPSKKKVLFAFCSSRRINAIVLSYKRWLPLLWITTVHYSQTVRVARQSAVKDVRVQCCADVLVCTLMLTLYCRFCSQ